MAYRDDVDALSARQASLERELTDKQRELADATRLLDDARARARLPLLDNIRIAAPCKANWSAMTGDERARHCGDCKKDVYNLSGMTREEAEQLIATRAGGLCVRYYQRADGTILLADCDIGHRRKLRKNLVIAGAAIAGLATATGLAAHTLSARPDDGMMMGTLAIDEPHVTVEIEPMGHMYASQLGGPERLTTSMIDRGIRPALPAIESCVHDPSAGLVRARVTVRSDGHVSSVSLKDLPDGPLTTCISDELHHVRFESTANGGTFIYPFTFHR